MGYGTASKDFRFGPEFTGDVSKDNDRQGSAYPARIRDQNGGLRVSLLVNSQAIPVFRERTQLPVTLYPIKKIVYSLYSRCSETLASVAAANPFVVH